MKVFKSNVLELGAFTVGYALTFVAAVQVLIYPLLGREVIAFWPAFVYFVVGLLLSSYYWLYVRNYTFQIEQDAVTLLRREKVVAIYSKADHLFAVQDQTLKILVVVDPSFDPKTPGKIPEDKIIKRHIVNMSYKNLRLMKEAILGDMKV